MPTKKPKESSSKSNGPNSGSAEGVSPNDRGASQQQSQYLNNAILAYSDNFKEAWTAAHKELPQAQGAQKLLNKIGDVQNALTPSPGQQAVVDALTTPVKALLNTPHIAESIHKGVDAFMEAAPHLMEALDAVGKIHPFINVAVLAFKAIYTLEKKRRGNDKRVLALYAEMKDMMEVLLQLNGVADPQSIGPDGKTIQGRMQRLCDNVAKDIKDCGNACDTYLQKKLLVKIFAGPIWEGRLVEFVDVFGKRRDEFKLALTVHITAAVDAFDLKLEAVHDDLSEKMKVMLDLFKEFVTPQQRELAAAVEKVGGDAVRNDEQAMETLAGVESKLTAGSESRGDKGGQFSFFEWQREINSSPDKAIQQNADFFNRKFEIQKQEIEEIVRRVGDRVISAVREGPHDRIVDPDIYHIWKDMGWRGSVKGRRFVMALRDYYVEEATTTSGTLTGPDSWAFKYINISGTRRILEAFDDDASGFVTVSEANNFTQSRPSGWSLPRWIAYWARGWKITCTIYCLKIEKILDAMIRLSHEVLSDNRRTIHPYINEIWGMVSVFVRSIEKDEGAEDIILRDQQPIGGGDATRELISHFEPYVAAEEKRLLRNLEVMNYRIDSPDTFRVIAGEGRIEMTLFPMLYLVLKRDLDKISLAQKYVLSDFEMSGSRSTISSILDTARERVDTLTNIFQQQNLKAEDQFKTFAEGLYNICSGDASTRDVLRELSDSYVVFCKEDEIPRPDSIPLSVLDHPLGTQYKADSVNRDPPELTLSSTGDDHPVLGVYYGFIYFNGWLEDPMFKFTFSKGEGGQTFVAAGSHYRERLHRDYKITGNWSPPLEDGTIPVDLSITYATEDYNIDLRGVFNPEENSLRGTGGHFDVLEFMFKRDPDFVRFYPAPWITNAGGRWKFAIRSVLDRIRRQAWSSQRIFGCIKNLKRFMELTVMRSSTKFTNVVVDTEYRAILPGLYESEAELCASLININASKTTIFYGVHCDSCGVIPAGSRIICMDCCHGGTIKSFCSNPECLEFVEQPHLSNHRVFKISRIVFDRDLGMIETIAGLNLRSARAAISQLEEEGNPMPKCEHCEIAVTLPSWCCVDCLALPIAMFICDSCEHKNLALNETHTEMHTIVRVTRETGKERSTEERLQSLENELTKMRQILEKLVEKSGGMVSKSVDEIFP